MATCGVIRFSSRGREKLLAAFNILSIILATLSLILLFNSIYVTFDVSSKLHSEKAVIRLIFTMIGMLSMQLTFFYIAGIFVCNKCHKEAYKKNSRYILKIWNISGYSSIINILIIGAMSAGVSNHIVRSMHHSMIRGMERYLSDISWKKIIDSLQYKLKCCGSNKYTDWHELSWISTYQIIINDSEIIDKTCKLNGDRVHFKGVPWSCCKLDYPKQCLHDPIQQNEYIDLWDELSTETIYETGCVEKLRQPIEYSFLIFILVTYTMFILQLLLTIISRYLYTSFKNSIILGDPFGDAPGWILGGDVFKEMSIFSTYDSTFSSKHRTDEDSDESTSEESEKSTTEIGDEESYENVSEKVRYDSIYEEIDTIEKQESTEIIERQQKSLISISKKPTCLERGSCLRRFFDKRKKSSIFSKRTEDELEKLNSGGRRMKIVHKPDDIPEMRRNSSDIFYKKQTVSKKIIYDSTSSVPSIHKDESITSITDRKQRTPEYDVSEQIFKKDTTGNDTSSKIKPTTPETEGSRRKYRTTTSKETTSNRKHASPESEDSRPKYQTISKETTLNRKYASPESEDSRPKYQTISKETTLNRKHASPESEDSRPKYRTTTSKETTSNRKRTTPESEGSRRKYKTISKETTSNRKRTTPESATSKQRYRKRSPSKDVSSNKKRRTPESDISKRRYKKNTMSKETHLDRNQKTGRETPERKTQFEQTPSDKKQKPKPSTIPVPKPRKNVNISEKSSGKSTKPSKKQGNISKTSNKKSPRKK